MKKKISKLFCAILVLNLLSINVSAMFTKTVLESTHASYLAGVRTSYSENYTDITFRNGYTTSKNTETSYLGLTKLVDVTYSYDCY